MAYSNSKTALNALTMHYVRELAGTPVKVNGAAPGHVATDFNGFRSTRTQKRERPSQSGWPPCPPTARPVPSSKTRCSWHRDSAPS